MDDSNQDCKLSIILPHAKTYSLSSYSKVSPDTQRKVHHLTMIARASLPGSDDVALVQQRLHKLLDSLDDEGDDDEEDLDSALILSDKDAPLSSLRQIRKAAMAAGAHQQTWFANDGIAPHRFAVGDIGYLPKTSSNGEKGWEDFVVLCNLFDEGLANMETKHEVNGKQGGWQGGPHRWDDLPAFELPGGIHG